MKHFSLKIKNLILSASVITLFAVSFHHVQAVSAPCFPFETKIDSIENGRDCLEVREYQCSTSINIFNHCQDEFYTYDDQGNFNTHEIIMNFEENTNSDLKLYYDLEKGTSSGSGDTLFGYT